ncbi:MAG: leucyl aminopeptidase [Candidatus Omnitrophica bacterium]|nr:leucyl aminopeptidase [Candidatus Omnitrophota bacterium]
MIDFINKAKFDKNAAILFCTEEQVKSKKYNFTDEDIKKQLQVAVTNKVFDGSAGQNIAFFHKNTYVIAIGCGGAKDISLSQIRTSLRSAILKKKKKNLKNIEILPQVQSDEVIHAIIEGVLLGSYRWTKYKTDKAEQPVIQKFLIQGTKKKFYEEIIKICEGTNLARDLVNENADVATSSFLEATIKKITKGQKNISLEILNKKELKAKGLGLHLAVNQGSENEPKLIIVKYTGAAKSAKYTALIGKGMTYDTGGLNLKPTGSIETMKMDMGGAAAVIGTLQSVLSLKLKKNILFVCGIAENVTDARSYKPGDVLTGYAGKTVEVANTDAEGRLVLADAISYTVRNYKPEKIIDIATLTGACIVALGYDYTALVTTDDKFARNLVHSSNITDDRVWRLPNYPELKKSVSSKIADIRNLGFPRGAGGTITAAEFLRQFTEDTTWAHLDIAGTSFVDGDSRAYFGHGGTGAGVRLLTHYLQQH